MRRITAALVTALGCACVGACGAGSPAAPAQSPTPNGPPPPAPAPAPTPKPATWNVDSLGVPRIVSTDYIDMSRITRISRFRSSAGHDNADDFETCRSMKHYYVPAVMAEAGQIAIRAPVTGTVTRLIQEWAGTQVHLTSAQYPAFTFVLYHVKLSSPLDTGRTLTEGQSLGTHIGEQTSSDIAVVVATPGGRRYVSWFDVMTDGLFARYVARGVAERSAFIIARAERDADRLTCDSIGTFLTRGALETWVQLN
ncbi:MAG: hypothetical protein ABIZ91_06865 [Gemmatimonadaceae bacterium]